MEEPLTYTDVVRALAFIADERTHQKRFWRDHYNEATPGSIGGCIRVLERLAQEWIDRQKGEGVDAASS